jgi:hypothetical protein
VSLVASLEIIELTQVTTWLRTDVLVFLPQVITAVFVLLISVVIAEVVQKLVVSSSKAIGIASAQGLGQAARWAILVFAFMVALDKIQILGSFIQPLFIGIIAAISLALGLSFGLGGRDAAARYIEKVKNEVSSK